MRAQAEAVEQTRVEAEADVLNEWNAKQAIVLQLVAYAYRSGTCWR